MRTEKNRSQIIEELHDRYAGIIFDLCFKILRDHQQAEDAVQDTFLNAFRALDSFVYGDSHLPWLYRIGTNVCLKAIRQHKRKGALLMENAGEATPGENVDPGGTLDARSLLEKLGRKLDERNQEIVINHFLVGMTQEEIAASMGISRRSVVKRLTRIRATMVKYKVSYEN